MSSAIGLTSSAEHINPDHGSRRLLQARNGSSMRAGERLFLAEKRSCSGHNRKTDFDPYVWSSRRGSRLCSADGIGPSRQRSPEKVLGAFSPSDFPRLQEFV